MDPLTYFVTKEDPYSGKLATHSFQAKPRKDGSLKATGMLPFYGYTTIIDKFNVAGLSLTPEASVAKFISDRLSQIASLERKRQHEISLVNQANSGDIPIHEFMPESRVTPKITI